MANNQITSALDQPVQLPKEALFLLDQVDEVIEKSLTAGDPRAAFRFGQSLRQSQQVSGVALAKLLAKLFDCWDTFQAAGVDDEFVNVVFDEMGVAPATTKKYVSLWNALFENKVIPEYAKAQLIGRPIDTLLLLTGAAKEGNFDEKEWLNVAAAPDKATVRDMIHAKRGQRTSSKAALKVVLDKNGHLYCRRGAGKKKAMAVFNVDDDTIADDDIWQALNRLMNASGVDWKAIQKRKG